MTKILETLASKCSKPVADWATDLAKKEVMMVLHVKDELKELQRIMEYTRYQLKDAEKRRFNDSYSDLRCSQLKSVMDDAAAIIDRCNIEANELLADENPQNETFRLFCEVFAIFSSCFTTVPLRREIGKEIKKLNDRLKQIEENYKQFKLEKSELVQTPPFTLVDSQQTCPLVDPFVVGEEVEVAANELVNLLITDQVEEKCRIFALAGMRGIGKTTLAQKIFNHSEIQDYFSIKVWVCVSQKYSDAELLKQVIRSAKGSCGDANTKSELLPILRDSIASCESLFLVLDDVWRADVWVDLLRVPLQTANTSVRILVTTRYEAVAKAMNAAYTHNVMNLSIESSWDMLRNLLFSEREEQPLDELKELGIGIATRCGGLPLAIKDIAGVLSKRERTTKEWQNILMSDAGSISGLHEQQDLTCRTKVLQGSLEGCSHWESAPQILQVAAIALNTEISEA